jgi:hypothetical protein
MADITLPEMYQQKSADVAPGKPSYENNMLWALLQAGWKMEQIAYQYPIDGGRASRNGLVIDFVLFSPSAIPIQVGATWWHRDSGEEGLEDARIAARFGRLPLRFFDQDVDTKAHALASVLREIGHG